MEGKYVEAVIPPQNLPSATSFTVGHSHACTVSAGSSQPLGGQDRATLNLAAAQISSPTRRLER